MGDVKKTLIKLAVNSTPRHCQKTIVRFNALLIVKTTSL
jgi:hypothetical protein